MRKLAAHLGIILAIAVFMTPARAAEVVVQIGYENNPGEPIDLACKEWKRLVEEESNGTMKVELYPSSQLGSKNDIMDQMLAGDSVITLADGSFFAERGAPDFDIIAAPYIFDDWDQCWKLLRSDWWKEQERILADNGMQMLAANWIYGERHTLTTKPVRKVEDMAGMKIRVPNSPMFIATFEAFGAAPTPLALGEVYTSLQQGVINGLENPLPVLYNGRFQEVAKYLTLDKHIAFTANWICGTDFFATLTPEQQRILIDSGNKAGEYNNVVVTRAAEDVIGKFKDEGVEIISVDIGEFKKAAEAVYKNPKVVGKWTPGLYETVRKAMQ